MAYTDIEDVFKDGKDAIPKMSGGVLITGEFGEQVLAAKDISEIPPELLPPTLVQSDTFLLDLFTWTGSQVVGGANVFFNYFALPGITKAAGGTANLSIVSGNLKFPVRHKPSQVMFSVRISGTIAGGAGTSREWRTQTRRTDGTTIVGSDASIKVQGTDITNRDAVLASYTLNELDPFMVNGIQLGMYNISTQDITLTSVSIRMMQIINPE